MVTWEFQSASRVPRSIFNCDRECHWFRKDGSSAPSCVFIFRIRCHLLIQGTRHKPLGCSFHQEWTRICGMCHPNTRLKTNRKLWHKKQNLNRNTFNTNYLLWFGSKPNSAVWLIEKLTNQVKEMSWVFFPATWTVASNRQTKALASLIFFRFCCLWS